MSPGCIIFALFIFVVAVLCTVLLCREYRRAGYDAGYTDGWRGKHGDPTRNEFVPVGTLPPPPPLHNYSARCHCNACVRHRVHGELAARYAGGYQPRASGIQNPAPPPKAP